METTLPGTPAEVVRIERWSTEIPLRVLIAVISLGIWVALIVSVIGAIYAVIIGMVLFLAHLGLIAHVRGSAVRLSPEQFPEIYHRVREIGVRAGLKREPEAYIMQAGGALNAFATKFLRSHVLVLFSDLLEACGDDAAARDMVIGHEIGHLKCGHLKYRWLLFPGLVFPLIGSAYSRACEYTCDRYGAALCGDPRGALRGLAILAAGGRHGPRVNLESLTEQRRDMSTGLMTLGMWLSSHPPLAHRIAELDPALRHRVPPDGFGALKAIGVIAGFLTVPFLVAALAALKLAPAFTKAMEEAQAQAEAQTGSTGQAREAPPLSPREAELARDQVQKDFAAMAEVAETFRVRHGRYPTDTAGIYTAWDAQRAGQRVPHDPFDGNWYGYATNGGRYWLWSAGPDMRGDTDDDIEFASSAP